MLEVRVKVEQNVIISNGLSVQVLPQTVKKLDFLVDLADEMLGDLAGRHVVIERIKCHVIVVIVQVLILIAVVVVVVDCCRGPVVEGIVTFVYLELFHFAFVFTLLGAEFLPEA